MIAPRTAGSYEARFNYNDGYKVLARTGLTVQGAAPPPPPPPPPPPSPVISVTPSNPSIPDTTPKGTVVATVSVKMSDGSPFTGTLRFGAPNFDSGGIFALQMTDLANGSIIINPAGPGVGPNTATVTDHITLEALP